MEAQELKVLFPLSVVNVSSALRNTDGLSVSRNTDALSVSRHEKSMCL